METTITLSMKKKDNIMDVDIKSIKVGQLSYGNQLYLNHFNTKTKIVIIDDEAKIRILFSKVLFKAGYDTVSFGDNAKAIQYLKDKNNLINLLLLDIDMPHIDGRYFCEMTRIKHPQAKIIIASNYGIAVQKYLIFNADDYFDKSDGIYVLKNKIKRILSFKD